MANTVNILGFANTFGDWIVATNADSNEINSIGKYDWTKDSGTLILNGAGTSLTVGNNAIIAGQLQVTGTSSSATIDNNLTVGKQVYFTNTSQSLVASGTVTSNGTIFATNTGTSLSVSNNSTLGGTLAVSGTTTISNTINVLGATTLQNSLTVGAGAGITGNVSITGNTYTSFLTANNRINAGQLTVTSNGNFGGSIIATSSAVVNGYDVISYILGAFTQANSAYSSQNTTGTYANSAYSSQNVTGTYANSAYYTANSAQLYANGAFTQANAVYIFANSVFATHNTSISAAFTQANSAYGSQNTTGTYANAAFLFANNLQSGAQTFNNMTLTGTSLTATNAIGTFQSLIASTITAQGNFIVTGATIYTSNSFVLNANTNTPVTSSFIVNRGTANNQPNGIPNANAAIRWNESNKYFDILDVNNGVLYSQIMTANMISDSTTSTSTTTVPTNKGLTGAFIQANSAFSAANTADSKAVTAGSYANSAFSAANTADSKAVTAGSYANSAFSAANTAALSAAPAFLQANSAYTQANTATTNAATADSKAVTAGSYANSAYTQANTATTNAATADSKAVTAGSYANSAFTTANNALPRTGGTLSGDLGVTGNLFVNGTSSYINVSTFQTVDSLIELAANNLSDTIDIGFYGQYASVGTKYAGLVRSAASNFYLFQGIATNPTSNSVGTITFANYGTLNANIAAGQITSSQPLPVTSGGTGVTTSTGTGSNVLATSPSISSPTFTTPILGTPQSGNLSNCTFPTLNQNTTGTAAGLSATLAVASGGTGVTTSTGSGSVVLSTSPSLTTPILGTPQSGNLSNCTFPTLNQNTTGTAYNITQYSINQNLSTTSTPTFDTVTTGMLYSTTNAGSGRGVCIKAPSGDATAGILQFTNNAISAEWANIAAPSSGVLNLNAATTLNLATAAVKSTGIIEITGDGNNKFRMRGDSSGLLQFYDVKDPDSGVYNYTLNMDGGLFAFNFGTTNSAYDTGTTKLSIDYNGNLTAVGNVTAYSDIKLKENITVIDSALNKTLKLRGVYYTRKDTKDKTRKVGVIAQEIQEILPEVVRSTFDKTDDSNTLSVDYGNITALLIEAIKELNEKVTNLQNQLANK